MAIEPLEVVGEERAFGEAYEVTTTTTGYEV